MALNSQHYIHFFDVLIDKWSSYIHEIHPLKQISQTLQSGGNGYTAEKIVFKGANLARGVRPMGTYPKNAQNNYTGFCELFIDVGINPPNPRMVQDPFTNYALSIRVLTTVDMLGKPAHPVKCAWHLDKDASAPSDFSHPLYHFQFGGKEIIKDNTFDFGNFLLLEAPRIMHPPLDIILAIDFIAHNFYDASQRANLISEKSYIKAVEEAKKQYWGSYSYAFASNFHSVGSVDATFAQNILGD